MKSINQSFGNYLKALRDLYQSFKESSSQKRKDFFGRIEKKIPFPFNEEYEYFFIKSDKRGYFPFPFFFFPPHPKYWNLIEENLEWTFEEVLAKLEEEFEVRRNDEIELSPGERKISKDLQELTDQLRNIQTRSIQFDEMRILSAQFIEL